MSLWTAAGEDDQYISNLAKKIVDQEVRPLLEDLSSRYTRKGTPWYADLVTIGSAVPGLTGAYYAAQAGEAAAAVLSALMPFLAAAKAEKDRKTELSRSYLFYLLTLDKALKNRGG